MRKYINDERENAYKRSRSETLLRLELYNHNKKEQNSDTMYIRIRRNTHRRHHRKEEYTYYIT